MIDFQGSFPTSDIWARGPSAKAIAPDRARRRERSERSATLVLPLDTELRCARAGGRDIRLRGLDERARSLSEICARPTISRRSYP
jgi:hypothetical protein